MTRRRLLLVAVACAVVLSGCLGGLNAFGADSGPTATTESTTTVESATVAGTTTEAQATAARDAPRRATFDTREALAANASFSVPEADVPAPFAFQSGVVMRLGDGENVAMAYHDAENGSLENVLSIRKSENESAFDLSAGNATTVGDRDARFVAEADGGTLLWECENYAYRVSVQQFTDEFGEEELRAVAESVGCE